MKFNELDSKMRDYETSHDHSVPPEVYMVARIDGRSFTRLTKEICDFERPFDPVFRDHMINTTAHLMDCGFRVVYGYTQSDEISLLFHRDEQAFGRSLRKFISILAGEASAKFSLLLGDLATFDCRISQLPDMELVIDYYRWRNEDAKRNALSAHCYWILREEGKKPEDAAKILDGMENTRKEELLFEKWGISYDELPNWQKQGVGLYWENYEKQGFNPLTGKKVTVNRKRLKIDMDLPGKEQYSEFIHALITLQEQEK